MENVEQEIRGVLQEFMIVKEGFRRDKSKWVLRNYCVNGDWYSGGFNDFTKFVNKNVTLWFTNKPYTKKDGTPGMAKDIVRLECLDEDPTSVIVEDVVDGPVQATNNFNKPPPSVPQPAFVPGNLVINEQAMGRALNAAEREAIETFLKKNPVTDGTNLPMGYDDFISGRAVSIYMRDLGVKRDLMERLQK